ncbi:glycosyltransferase family 2 protein [Salisediminibacterium halotolerans]|uniref:Teichuronic acid biosynthesis glycosyltransferase TuaG n=1 Tax=Salisediminibacterium halotolerans TaxID=517425 RepID=A0A1H9WP29_9BACI|nr:glycosyltransferase family 2 protein [Salisediminibacterium haloalkalitolerans]SES35672.1 teichuronic acid biosynthesis glycosyltransferase TuaG [Salisediminibacterium haloalkalitolerans]
MTAADPRVSIITPAYNAERNIAETIASVQTQTYSDWEIIIVDDQSTDKTVAVIKEMQQKDSRIRLEILETNSGPAVARNKAISLARGRYIAFLDSDDQWLPEKLTKQLQFMAERDAAFSYTDYYLLNDDQTLSENPEKLLDKIDYSKLLKSNVIGCLTVLIDTEKTGPFEMVDIRTRQDYTLWLELMKRGFPAHLLDEPLALYRVGTESISSDKIKMAKQNWHVYRQIEGLNFLQSCWYFSHYMRKKLWKQWQAKAELKKGRD